MVPKRSLTCKWMQTCNSFCSFSWLCALLQRHFREAQSCTIFFVCLFDIKVPVVFPLCGTAGTFLFVCIHLGWASFNTVLLVSTGLSHPHHLAPFAYQPRPPLLHLTIGSLSTFRVVPSFLLSSPSQPACWQGCFRFHLLLAVLDLQQGSCQNLSFQTLITIPSPVKKLTQNHFRKSLKEGLALYIFREDYEGSRVTTLCQQFIQVTSKYLAGFLQCRPFCLKCIFPTDCFKASAPKKNPLQLNFKDVHIFLLFYQTCCSKTFTRPRLPQLQHKRSQHDILE